MCREERERQQHVSTGEGEGNWLGRGGERKVACVQGKERVTGWEGKKRAGRGGICRELRERVINRRTT